MGLCRRDESGRGQWCAVRRGWRRGLNGACGIGFDFRPFEEETGTRATADRARQRLVWFGAGRWRRAARLALARRGLERCGPACRWRRHAAAAS